jgi:nitrite reductase/ring-hydroxylating ferredoxin subunit
MVTFALELHCPHRGTSLEFGLIGDKGIRCCGNAVPT